jgi:anti-sigma factor RsiW
MVTLILLFLFLSPRVINYGEKPVERAPRPGEVLVKSDGSRGIVYQISANGLPQSDGSVSGDRQLTAAMEGVIEPIAGEVTLERWEPVKDSNGKITEYRVWARR